MSKKKSTKSMAQQIQVLSGKIGKLTQEKNELTQENTNLSEKLRILQDKVNGKINITDLINNAAHKPAEKPENILITIDGVNGAGKSTLIHRVLPRAFEYAGFTDYNRIKESELAPPEFKPMRNEAKARLDYPSDRVREATIGRIVTNGRIKAGTTNLLHRLKENRLIILDRYIWSTIAYQLSAGTTIDEAMFLVEGSFIIPDYSLLLTANPEVARKRALERSIKDNSRGLENVEEISKKIRGYKKLHGLVLNNYPGNIDLIDTTGLSEKEVAMAFIANALTKYLEPAITDKMIEYCTSQKYDNNHREDAEKDRLSA